MLFRSLELLAMTEEVRSGNWERMLPLLTRLKETQIPAVVFYALPDGSYYTVEKGKTDQNIKDRAYFPKVMAGERTIGDLVVSRSTGMKVMVATVPVKHVKNVIGALGVAIHLDKLSEVLARELQLPPNMVLYAINKQGTTALHSVTKLIFEDPAKQKSETLTRAVKEMLSKEEGIVTYEFDGKRKKAYFKTSPLTGWRFALAVTTGRSDGADPDQRKRLYLNVARLRQKVPAMRATEGLHRLNGDGRKDDEGTGKWLVVAWRHSGCRGLAPGVYHSGRGGKLEVAAESAPR